MVYFWARGYQVADGSGPGDALGPEVEQPNISFNQMFVGIDIEIGEGNAGAIAIRHQGAEGSAIQDCEIDATHGLIGIQGGIGSGGGSANVTVVGRTCRARLYRIPFGYTAGADHHRISAGRADAIGDSLDESADTSGGGP